MGLIKGGFLRLFQTLLYFICFCCAAIVLGIYSYFLAVRADRDEEIWQWERAVEGLSGAAVVYTIFAVILTCCLGGVAFFSFLGLVLDLLFAGAFIAIAVMTRDGASSCTGFVRTPLGDGDANAQAQGYGGSGGNNYTYQVTYRTACKLNTACFAVAIVAIIFFIITAFMQISLVRSHKKEKRYGPSPDNGYTSGPAKKRNFWTRKNNKRGLEKDAELGPTGTAVGNDDTLNHSAPAPATGNHTGYYTQPTGTGAQNPYGYQNGTATNY